MSKDKGKDKVADLKNQTRLLRLEIKKLRSRNKELKSSRDNWKQKYKKVKEGACMGRSGHLKLKAKGHRILFTVVPIWGDEFTLMPGKFDNLIVGYGPFAFGPKPCEHKELAIEIGLLSTRAAGCAWNSGRAMGPDSGREYYAGCRTATGGVGP